MAPHAIPELHVHLVAAVANGLVVEWFYPGQQVQKFIAELFDEPVEPKETKNGMMKVPQKPGLGLKINKKVFEKYKVS
jgi:L-alanine-DL-glutamate epimerase-like enolase superfamily enzyme